MNTFLPVNSFKRSAELLDYRRLGKQRVEAYTIVRILLGQVDGGSYSKHPAVLMWERHEYALVNYGYEICSEWRKRGYKDNLQPRFVDFYDILKRSVVPNNGIPWWFSNKNFHLSHRSNLLRKDTNYYSKFPEFAGVPDNLDYWWPTKHTTQAMPDNIGLYRP